LKLYYYCDPVGNFGDDLNPWLWPKVFPDMFDGDDRTIFVGIGTILNQDVPRESLKVVFGSGVGLGKIPQLDENWKVYFVRGPHSSRALGLPAEMAVTDPAILVQLFSEPAEKRYDFCFMPHLESQIRAQLSGLDLKQITESRGIHYIDPCSPVEETLRAMQAARVVIAEAMHAAIVADALRIPWVPVRFFDHILGFKWRDWCASLDLEYRPHDFVRTGRLPLESEIADGLQRVIHRGEVTLSTNATNATALAGVRRQVDRLRTDWMEGRFPGSGPNDGKSGAAPIERHPGKPFDTWWHRLHAAAKAVESMLPEGEPYVLIDEEQFSCEFVAGHTRVPFVYDGDCYVGQPVDTGEAIQRLERFNAAGEKYLVIGWPAFWWFDHYANLLEQLKTCFQLLHAGDLVFVFRLEELGRR
jgi:hypothetical protein